LFDSAEIDIPCPQCGHKTKKTVGWIKTHHHHVCGCGFRVDLDADELLAGLGQVGKTLDNLRRTVGKIE